MFYTFTSFFAIKTVHYLITILFYSCFAGKRGCRHQLKAFDSLWPTLSSTNLGKPKETWGNQDTGRTHKIEPWRSRLDFLHLLVHREDFKNLDFLASHQNVKNQRISQTWEAHVAMLKLKTCLLSTFWFRFFIIFVAD